MEDEDGGGGGGVLLSASLRCLKRRRRPITCTAPRRQHAPPLGIIHQLLHRPLPPPHLLNPSPLRGPPASLPIGPSHRHFAGVTPAAAGIETTPSGCVVVSVVIDIMLFHFNILKEEYAHLITLLLPNRWEVVLQFIESQRRKHNSREQNNTNRNKQLSHLISPKLQFLFSEHHFLLPKHDPVLQISLFLKVNFYFDIFNSVLFRFFNFKK